MSESAPITKRSMSQKYLEGFVEMSSWKKKLLWLFTLVSIAGFAGHVTSLVMFGPRAVATTQAVEVGTNARGVINAGDIDDTVEDVQQRALKWWEWLSPHLWKAGISFVGGFLIGMAARTFLKWLMIFAALAAVVFFSLKYLGVLNINIDTTGAEAAVKGGVDWAKNQSDWVKTYAMAWLPSTVMGTAGLFVGFLRR
jgi:uncharacterized membrane protein (Fun14 family)